MNVNTPKQGNRFLERYCMSVGHRMVNLLSYKEKDIHTYEHISRHIDLTGYICGALMWIHSIRVYAMCSCQRESEGSLNTLSLLVRWWWYDCTGSVASVSWYILQCTTYYTTSKQHSRIEIADIRLAILHHDYMAFKTVIFCLNKKFLAGQMV
jgi:hypothetical protein